jgi:hypothetical protein
MNENNINSITAKNAQGKTSFLETICIALFGEGFPSRHNKVYSSSIICEFPFGFVGRTPSSDIVNQSRRTKSVIHEETFQKLFVSCSLSSNPYVRSLSMGIRSLQLNDCCLLHQKLTKIASESGSGEGDYIDVAGIPNRCESNILMDILRLDFECLGKRLWTTVIVDALLASSKHDAGVRLGHGGSKSHIFTSVGKKETTTFLPRTQKDRPHACSLANTKC